MVTLNFKLSDSATLEVPLSGPVNLGDLLDQVSQDTGNQLGRVIAVRQGKVMASHEAVEDQDIIEIYPAISGG